VVVIVTFTWASATLFLLLASDLPDYSILWMLWFWLLMIPSMLAFMLPYALVIIQAVYRARRSDLTALRPGTLIQVTSAWGLVCLIYASEPLVEPFTSMPPLFFGLALLASWVFFLIPASWGAWKRSGRGSLGRVAGYLLPMPMVVVVLIIIGLQDLPLKTRFELSEPALFNYFQEFEREGTKPSTESRLVGLYTVEGIYEREGCVVLQTNSGIDLEAGFAYCDNGPEPSEHMEHLRGNWWVYRYFE